MFNDNNKFGILLILLSFLFFSSSNAASRYILYLNSIPISIYFVYVKLFAVIILLGFGLIVFGKTFFYIENRKIVFIRCMILMINNICLTFSLLYLPLDIFYSIVFIMPLMTSILGFIVLKEKFSWLNILAVIIGFMGILIVVQPNVEESLVYIGVLTTIITAITGSLSGIIARKYLQNENPYSATFYVAVCSFSLGIIMLIFEGKVSDFNLISNYITFKISAIIFFSALFTIIASSLFMKAYQISKATTIAPTQYTQLLWGIIFGYALFDDRTSFSTLIGCGIIIFATFFNFYVSRENKNEFTA
ncbi:MAG: DMT family transporter [Alphaproteobacteria bacterium]|jgi:S-adenosylmethionine uptake transporter|nr:DMT family transporter [Alphaproteobacteria bacterium]